MFNAAQLSNQIQTVLYKLSGFERIQRIQEETIQRLERRLHQQERKNEEEIERRNMEIAELRNEIMKMKG